MMMKASGAFADAHPDRTLRGLVLPDISAGDRRPYGAHLLDTVEGRPWACAVLALLIRAGAGHILLVAAPPVVARLQRLLGDGSRWGVRVSFALPVADTDAERHAPSRMVAATLRAATLRAAAEFPGRTGTVLHNAANILHGAALPAALQQCAERTRGATLLCMPPEASVAGSDPGPWCRVEQTQRVTETSQCLSDDAPSQRGAAWRLMTGLCVCDARLSRALLEAGDDTDQADRREQDGGDVLSPVYALGAWYLQHRALYAVTAGAQLMCEPMLGAREATAPVAVRETDCAMSARAAVSARALAACPAAAAFARRRIGRSELRELARAEPQHQWRDYLEALAADDGASVSAESGA